MTISKTLNILANFAPLPPPGSTEYSHLIAESLRRTLAPRRSDYEPNGLTKAVQDSLGAMGHTLGTRGLATANSIMVVRGGLQGVGEPRSGGVAIGY